MKSGIQPTSHEKRMRESDVIVSKTDTKGRITYGNRIFVEFSGYSLLELLGTQHNIIRHPDMPRGVFKYLRDPIATDKEVFAYVKNMAKDGSFYWVWTNVTPDRDAQGVINGYFSVRRQPKRGAVDAMADVYRIMLEEERKAGSRDACAASLGWLVNVLNSKGVGYDEFILSL
jgi:PAS domain S-box-containing protein